MGRVNQKERKKERKGRMGGRWYRERTCRGKEGDWNNGNYD